MCNEMSLIFHYDKTQMYYEVLINTTYESFFFSLLLCVCDLHNNMVIVYHEFIYTKLQS